MYSQNIWFVGFDAIPKPFSANYCFIYIMKTFVGKKVTLVGRIKNTGHYFRLRNLPIKGRGTGGYALLPEQYEGEEIRFFIYESENSYSEIKKMLEKPNVVRQS